MRKTLFCFLALLLSAVSARAIPAYPGWLTHVQPDGSVITYRLQGDEHCHAMVSTDGRLLKLGADGWMTYDEEAAGIDFGQYYEENSGRSRIKRALDIDGFPTIGTVRGLVLLVEFSDNSFNEEYTREVFDSLMNQPGCNMYGATGSSRDFFMDQSMGQFTPEFDVCGPIKLTNNIRYYGQNNGRGEDMRAHQMIKDACVIAHDSLQIDFSQYDYNEDGNVDFVYVIYAGYAESYGAASHTIWPHASDLPTWGIQLELDGKLVSRYACSSELKYVSGSTLEGIGTFCHEFGHVLGLPDMYNVYQSSITQFGAWDVMDTGCYNNESRTPCAYSAFERASLRWLEFQDIDTPADEISLEELTQNNVAYRIRTVYDNEYFTLENRQKVGWDAHQPGTGLMIIHIDYNENTWRNNGVNSGMHPRYDLVEANGRQGSDQQNNLYPIAGNNIFTDYSTPNSLTWDGTPTEKGITDIRVEDGVVKFRFMHDRLRRPKMNEVSDITANSALLSWNAVDEAIGYRLVVNEELPDSLNPVLFDEDFSLMEDGSYPAAHYEELSTELDDHTHIPGWSGSQIYSAGGYVRIGMYGANGRLTTPHIGFSSESDSCFVAFHAVSYPGKTVNYTVSLLDENGETVESQTLKAKKTEEPVVLVFHGVADGSRFRFDTQKERLFLNDFRVLTDTLSGIWEAGPKEWTIDSIAETQYRLEGLAQNRTYHCKVMALATDGLTSSLFSDELQFTTLSTSGITAAPAALEREAWYDLQGRRVSQPGRGLYIRRTTGADGQTRTEKIICR